MCSGWVWDDVAKRLAADGHGVRVVDQLPSGGSDPNALGDLIADADHVRQILDAIDEPVVLVGHSYGGMVLAELADHPKVRHSVYLTAVWPRRGQSLMDMYGGVLPRALRHRDDGTICATDDLAVLRETFAKGLNRDATEQMLTRLVLQSRTSITTACTAPDRTHPTTYMIAKDENEPAVAAQEGWAANADHVVRLPGAHMLMLYRSAEVAEALMRVSIP